MCVCMNMFGIHFSTLFRCDSLKSAKCDNFVTGFTYLACHTSCISMALQVCQSQMTLRQHKYIDTHAHSYIMACCWPLTKVIDCFLIFISLHFRNIIVKIVNIFLNLNCKIDFELSTYRTGLCVVNELVLILEKWNKNINNF